MPVIPFVAIRVAAMVAAAVIVPAVAEHVHSEHRDHEQYPQPVALQPFHLVTPLSKRPVRKFRTRMIGRAKRWQLTMFAKNGARTVPDAVARRFGDRIEVDR